MRFALPAMALLVGCHISDRPVAMYASDAERQPVVRPLKWTPQYSGVYASLRGVCAVSGKVCWASGGDGTVLRTLDAGKTWTARPVPGAKALDFRDVHAFDADSALVLSAGEPAKIFKTRDGGASWTEVYSNETVGVFFDAFDFWDTQHGIAFGDPIDGTFLIITTDDGGDTWQRVPAELLPKPLDGEAGFAASGTCLVTFGKSHVWIGTGGAAARVLRSADRGKTWDVATTPIISGNAAAGVFSLAFRDALHGVAVGGDYGNPSKTEHNAACTSDGGRSWQPVTNTAPAGYRSAVAYLPGTRTLIAVGPRGSDYSADDGQSWSPLGDSGYHAISFASDGVGWAVGPDGRISLLTRR